MTRPTRVRALALTLTLGVSVCTALGCGEDPLQRMKTQPKYLPYESNPFFADARGMRAPPEGTVPRERTPADVRTRTGRERGAPSAPWVRSIPIPIDESLLARGRRRFDILCAACHGLLGDGQSVVARNMSLRPPPSLLALADRSDGYLFDAITHGFGLMPAWGDDLPLEERWAIVAYVRALQLSQRAPLALLNDDEKSRLDAQEPSP